MTQKILILVVEDEAIVAADIQAKLEGMGFEVAAPARSGAEAVEKAGALHPDLILMDIRMPGAMDGVEAAEAIRAKQDVPIVFLTAFADRDTLARARLAEPFGYIVKPFTERELHIGVEIGLCRHRTEQKLLQKEKQYQDLVENLQEIIYTVNKNGCVTYISPVVERLMGYTPDELLGQPFDKFVFAEDRPLIQKSFGEVLKDRLYPREYRVYAKNGGIRWVRTHSRPVLDGGEVVGVQGMLVDVTDRKRIELLLDHQVQFFNTLLAAAPTPIFYIDLEGRYLGCNHAFEAMNGKNQDEIRGKTVFELWPGEFAQTYHEQDLNLLRNPGTQVYESSIKAADGTARDVLFYKSTFNDLQGDVAGIIGVILDITDRKRAEEALANEATRRCILFEQSRDGIVVLDQNGKVFEANQSYCQMLGYSPEEIRSLYVWDWDTQWKPEQIMDMLRRVDETGDHFETLHRRKDGSVCEVEISSTAALCEGRKLIFCVCRDVTERKRAQEALRISEEKFRKSFYTSPDAISITRLSDGMFVSVNKGFERLSGYAEQEVIGKTSLQLNTWHDPEDRKRVVAELEAKGTVEDYEALFSGKNGISFHGLMSATIVEIMGIPHVLNIIRDITERKQAEKALKASKDFLDQIINNIGDPLFVKDRRHRWILLNDSFCSFMGHTREELIGKSDRDFFDQSEADVFWEKDEQVFAEGRENLNEEFFTDAQGVQHTILTKKNIYKDLSSGEALIVGIIRDITDRKRSEDALRESEVKYRQLVETLQEGIWVIDNDTCTTFVNLHMAEILGYRVEDMLGKSLFDFMDEQGRAIAQANVERRKAGISEQHDFEFIRRDGSRVYTTVATAPLLDEKGQYRGALAGVSDITDRKRMEDALKSNEQHLRELTAHLQVVREQEGRRIAVRIHDELGQALTALKMDISWIETNADKGGGALLDRISGMKSLMDTTIKSVQRISMELRPSILDDLGLASAIEWYRNEFAARTGLACRFSSSPEDMDVNKDIATTLYRIVQEALTNIARHARATRVDIDLCLTDQDIELTVADDGAGLSEAQAVSPCSFGLIQIRERAMTHGGKAEFESMPGRGTVVRVSIPVVGGKQ
ncbi:MAG: PAS domain S-box protein [Lentisphaerota bacterium]